MINVLKYAVHLPKHMKFIYDPLSKSVKVDLKCRAMNPFHGKTVQEMLDQVALIPKPRSKASLAAAASQSKPEDFIFQPAEAIGLLKAFSVCFWDDISLKIVVNSGLDAGCMNGLRGTIKLPHLQKSRPRIVVFASGDALQQAMDAKANICGGEELIEGLMNNTLQYDCIIATPTMMPTLSRAAKILGPLGMMPNVKTGTLSNDVRMAIDHVCSTLMFRVERGAASTSFSIGPLSFSADHLMQNFDASLSQLVTAFKAVQRPKNFKGSDISTIKLMYSDNAQSSIYLNVSKPLYCY